MLAALAVFAATYFALSFQNAVPGLYVSRSAAALLGAVAMVAFGVLRLDQAYSLVDLDTIVFLLGMMIVIGYLEASGFFEEVEVLVLKRARTTRGLLALVILSSGILSALFMNDTICLMMTPVLVRLVARARLRHNAFLIALATSANIGSVMTPMGNPQNMIVAIHSGIRFSQFTATLAPVAALGLWLNYRVFLLLYPEKFARGRALDLHDPPVPRARGRLLYACLAGVTLLLLLFAINVSPPLSAIAVAALLILAGATKPRNAFRHVDWELLLMFSGLFVVMGGLRQAGALEPLFRLMGPSGSPLLRLGAVSASSAIVSNLVSNVPCVVFFSNLLPRLGNQPPLWLALAMASTVAGNLTIIGSVANLIVFESAKDSAKVGFWEYFRVGAPVALGVIALGTFYLAFVS